MRTCVIINSVELVVPRYKRFFYPRLSQAPLTPKNLIQINKPVGRILPIGFLFNSLKG
jgi:hypothetical protein